MKSYKNGKIVRGIVTGVERYGFFVKVDDHCSGMVHISEISYEYIVDINSVVKVGDIINVRIIDNSLGASKLRLSIKDVDYKKIIHGMPIEILETKHGFSTLKRMLPIWISLEEPNLFSDDQYL